MARPKRRPTIVPRKWLPTLKAKFLRYSFLLKPSALKELAVQVRNNTITLGQWAENWGVENTWIEEWANETLTWWHEVPPDVDSGFVVYPAPSDNRAEEGFSFTITDAVPDCRLAFRVTVGGARFGTGEPTDDWERFRSSLHRRLEAELESYREKSLRIGMLRESDLSTDEDLELKLQVAALYVFGKKGAREIGEHPGVAGERSAVSRRLKKILQLLELPPPKRGPKGGSKGAKN